MSVCQPRQERGNPHVTYTHMLIHRSAVRTHPVPLSPGPSLTQPLSWKALEPRAIGGNLEVQAVVDTRDHDVALVGLVPCPLGSISAGLVRGVSNPGPQPLFEVGNN